MRDREQHPYPVGVRPTAEACHEGAQLLVLPTVERSLVDDEEAIHRQSGADDGHWWQGERSESVPDGRWQ